MIKNEFMRKDIEFLLTNSELVEFFDYEDGVSQYIFQGIIMLDNEATKMLEVSDLKSVTGWLYVKRNDEFLIKLQPDSEILRLHTGERVKINGIAEEDLFLTKYLVEVYKNAKMAKKE